MTRVYLLDATFELFRAFHAGPSIAAPDGRQVGGVYTLMGTVLALLREEGVTHIGAATDTTVRSFRNEMFAPYKSGEGVEPELLAQFPLAEDALRALGITVWPMDEFEADDALATAVDQLAGEVDQIVIATPDKDLAQCVDGDRVVLLDRRTGRSLDAEGVRERYGVPPASIPDYLALVGDSADGFPGLRGWGPKSAAAILGSYGTIEAIPERASQWDVAVRGAERLAKVLREEREAARLYKELATLRRDVPMTVTVADLAWRGVPRAAFHAFCEAMGFEGMRERPHLWRED